MASIHPAAILGGAGFLGSHLAEALLARGVPVRVFDRKNADLRNLEDLRGAWTFFGGDFLNPNEVARILDGVDTVYHLISTTIPASSNENPVYDVETNLVSTLKLLDLARGYGVKRVVFVSSGGTVYGIPREVPIAEAHPTEPQVSYGVVKLAIEKYLQLYHRLHGMEYRIIRLSNPYGPRQDPAGAQGAAAVFLGRALRGEPIDVWGDGSVVRDYIYVADAVAGILAAQDHPAETGLYNIGSGRGVSISDLVAAVSGVCDSDVEVRHLPGRPIDVPVNVLDISRARAELGWEPRVSLEKGLALTWSWLSRTGE